MGDDINNWRPVATERCICAFAPVGRACHAHARQRTCAGWRDTAEEPQACESGELPQGARHRCEPCRTLHQRARGAVKQGRYRQRMKETLDRLCDIEKRYVDLCTSIRTLVTQWDALIAARDLAAAAACLQVLEETVNELGRLSAERDGS